MKNRVSTDSLENCIFIGFQVARSHTKNIYIPSGASCLVGVRKAAHARHHTQHIVVRREHVHG